MVTLVGCPLLIASGPSLTSPTILLRKAGKHFSNFGPDEADVRIDVAFRALTDAEVRDIRLLYQWESTDGNSDLSRGVWQP